MSPARQQRHVVARVQDIPEGERLIVEVAGRQVGIFHVDGAFHAILHRCPHLGGPLCLGPVVGLFESTMPGELHYDESRKFLSCPWHGWEFEITTGQSYCDPARMKARAYPVAVATGQELIDDAPGERVAGPYTAEKIPLAVEDDYIVLTMRAPRPPAAERAEGREP